MPLAYQSVHILVHHDEVHGTFQISGFVIHEAEDDADCPICEYEFANYCINTNSETAVLSFVFSKALNTFYPEYNPSYSGIHISLRAPPMQS